MLQRTDVETVWVILLDLFPLGSGVGSRQRDVKVGGVKALSQVHLRTLRRRNGQLRNTAVSSIQIGQPSVTRRMSGGGHCSMFIQELGHHETGRTGTDQEGMGASLGGDLLQAVHGARGGFDEGGIDIADVLDLEETSLGVRALQQRRVSRSSRYEHHDEGDQGYAYVFGETTIETQDTVGLEVLTEKLLAFSAVEASDKHESVTIPTGF